MSVAIYFIHNHQEWKQPKYAPNGEWRNILCFIHAMQYYSTTKRKRLLVHMITWIHLISCWKKKPISKVFMNLFKGSWEGSREGKTVGIANRSAVASAWVGDRNDNREAWRKLLGWRNFSTSWLWLWDHKFLSKLINLYTRKDDFSVYKLYLREYDIKKPLVLLWSFL